MQVPEKYHRTDRRRQILSLPPCKTKRSIAIRRPGSEKVAVVSISRGISGFKGFSHSRAWTLGMCRASSTHSCIWPGRNQRTISDQYVRLGVRSPPAPAPEMEKHVPQVSLCRVCCIAHVHSLNRSALRAKIAIWTGLRHGRSARRWPSPARPADGHESRNRSQDHVKFCPSCRLLFPGKMLKHFSGVLSKT